MKAGRQHQDIFATTCWTLIVKAGEPAGQASEAAWQELCKIYWYPLYVYARRVLPCREDAEDAVQGFLLSLFERKDLTGLSPARGRFRAYLLAAFKHYLSNEHLKASALKRGGGMSLLSLDWEAAGARFEVMDQSVGTPDEVYDREWALALLQNVLECLRAEWQAKNKSTLFDTLQVFLTVGRDDARYAEAAAGHGFSESYLRVNAHRLRRRYRELLRTAIEQTLENRDMVEDEMQALFKALE